MEVSRRPWLARQGTSRKDATADLYESQAVVEVTWSDGTVTYSCSMEGCAYTSDNPRSVSSHFRAHVRKGEHTPVGNLARPAVAKDVPIDPATIGDGYKGKGSTYSPTERLVKALAHALEQAGTADLTALAYAALMWSHDRPDLPDPEAREPLTDAQVIQRIRSLVGGRDPETEEALRNALGTVAEQEETVRLQEQALEHLRREVAALSERLTEMTEHRDSLQADLDAWLALAPRYKES